LPLNGALCFQGRIVLSKLIELSPSQLKSWEKIRVKGKTHFVLYRGVLGWGLYMFVVLTIFNHLQAVDFQLSELKSISLPTVFINFIICILGGFVFGRLTWSLSEKSYKRHKSIAVKT
jgi:hypothetical protein